MIALFVMSHFAYIALLPIKIHEWNMSCLLGDRKHSVETVENEDKCVSMWVWKAIN